MSLRSLALLGTSIISTVSAHGHVSGIVIGGKYYQGYDPSFQYQDPPPTVIGWSTPQDLDNGFVAPSAYSDPDIICHVGATPAGTSAKVAAGGTVELQWTPWPDSHHGPVLDYLAKCSGSCSDADKTSLEFFKIDQGGLISDASPPGTWASDKLIANNNSWTVTIPSSIASGNYVLRHEIIALHSAGQSGGAQNYPQCINIQVTGGGSDSPSGEVATKFYKANDPGILINIYQTLSKYVIPGPALFSGASSGGSPPASSAAPASSSAPASSAAPAPSSAAPAPSSAAPSSPAQSGGASYSAPAGSAPASSAPASSGSVVAPVSSSAPYGSSSKCTSTITLSSSAAPSGSSVGAISGSASIVPVASSYPSSGGFSLPVPSASGAPYPSIPASSVGPASGSASATSVPSFSSAPAPSASAPGGYPAPPPPSGGSVDMAGLMGRILKYIKQQFRQAEHAKDFKKF